MYTVAPIIKVPNQILNAPLGTDVRLECYVESYPISVNYWTDSKGNTIIAG